MTRVAPVLSVSAWCNGRFCVAGSIATVTPPKEFSLPSTAAYKFTKDSKPE